MDTQRNVCPRCARPFDCGRDAAGRCWCSTDFPPAMPLSGAERSCYCRDCLAALIALRRETERAT